jgi:hypothetical protein
LTGGCGTRSGSSVAARFFPAVEPLGTVADGVHGRRIGKGSKEGRKRIHLGIYLIQGRLDRLNRLSFMTSRSGKGMWSSSKIGTIRFKNGFNRIKTRLDVFVNSVKGIEPRSHVFRLKLIVLRVGFKPSEEIGIDGLKADGRILVEVGHPRVYFGKRLFQQLKNRGRTAFDAMRDKRMIVDGLHKRKKKSVGLKLVGEIYDV